MITHTFDLDMTPGDLPLHIHINKNDADFTLKFLLFSSVGTLNIEEGTTARIQGTKPGGGEYDAAATLSISDGTITVSGSKSMTDEVGVGVYEICLTHGEKELYSSNFCIDVEQTTLQ